jgi:hypothetical protein
MKKVIQSDWPKENDKQNHIELVQCVSEIDHMNAMVIAFNSLDEEAKYRVMAYFTDRFAQYLPKN